MWLAGLGLVASVLLESGGVRRAGSPVPSPGGAEPPDQLTAAAPAPGSSSPLANQKGRGAQPGVECHVENWPRTWT